MKNLRCKKKYGKWQYRKIMPNPYNDLDAPVYELYMIELEEPRKSHYLNWYLYYYDGMEFGCYDDMKYFVETGRILA